MKTLEKKDLRDERYYIGYEHQHYCVVSENQPKMIAKWDAVHNHFWFLRKIGIASIATKNKIPHIQDIDSMDEISAGFLPIKEIFPKEKEIID